MFHLPKFTFQMPKINKFWKSTIWAFALNAGDFVLDVWRTMWRRKNDQPDPFNHF